ncbi:MAG: protein TolR [Candidatus Aminicenantes bacterium]|nr:MAG: protein TolR [Candidatus Aminicenantes bacterium]HDJ23372.1 biopolymer transporter ExbD [Candidatus Aminicenantes bacterium]
MAFKYRSLIKKEVGTSLSEINVTPLVDVMLVLLIIFMVTAPMLQTGIGVNLPQAETQTSPAEEGLTLTITKDRYIHLNDTVINQFLLEQKLKEYFYGQEKKVVFLRADKELPYGFVIQVLDIIKRAGVEVVGLVIEPIKEQNRSSR